MRFHLCGMYNNSKFFNIQRRLIKKPTPRAIDSCSLICCSSLKAKVFRVLKKFKRKGRKEIHAKARKGISPLRFLYSFEHPASEKRR
jgi:hypothetical protein